MLPGMSIAANASALTLMLSLPTSMAAAFVSAFTPPLVAASSPFAGAAVMLLVTEDMLRKDGATAALAHRLDLVLEAEEEALEIGRDQLVESALGPLRDLAQLLGAGVVDRTAEAAVSVERVREERLDLGFARDINRCEVDPAASCADSFRNGFARLAVHIKGDHGRSALSERPAAPSGPGDKDHLVGEGRHRPTLPVRGGARRAATPASPQ
jgi:hypothetical protein